MARAKKTQVVENDVEGFENPFAEAAPAASANVGASELAAALREAIQASRPAEKKTIFNRKVNTPWTPPEGVTKNKLKRKIYQHGIPLSDRFLTNEQINLLNRLRPGVYLDGFVKVIRRRDKGVDVDYPVKTNAQRLRLVNSFGIRNFTELITRLNEEADKPRRSEFDLQNED